MYKHETIRNWLIGYLTFISSNLNWSINQLFGESAQHCYLYTIVVLTVKVKVTGYTALAYSYWVSFYDALQLPTINTDYSCHTKAVEFVYPIIWGSYHATSHH